MFYDNTKELEHIAELEEQLADAQRALDAEREKVKGVTQRAEYAEGRVRALLKRGDERDVQLAALQAQLRQAEGERDDYRLMYMSLTGESYDNPLSQARAELTTLRQLVAALPVVDVQEVSVWLSPDESGWFVSKRPALQAGLYWAKFRTQAEADSFRSLLAYRATLADVYQQRDGLQAQLRQVEGDRT